jgi:hypothetical protein
MASSPASTRTSPPCAATAPTGYPASPGIGDKTAAALLQQFGDLDGVIAAASTCATG